MKRSRYDWELKINGLTWLASLLVVSKSGLVTLSLWRKAEGLVALYEFKAEKAGE